MNPYDAPQNTPDQDNLLNIPNLTQNILRRMVNIVSRTE